MQNLLAPECYLSEDVWLVERELIFFRQWQYAGHASELAKDNDWILANIGGREVVVQNFGGELRAFSNVCSHRFSAIRTRPRGNGPLQCPYHQWTYNKEGLPFGIPLRKQFCELAEQGEIENLALERWVVDRCGGLVFVRLMREGPSLREFLDSSYDALQAASESLAEVVQEFEYPIEANWKLVIQNTLEIYHIVANHPRSFGRGINYKLLAAQRLINECVAPPHIVYTAFRDAGVLGDKLSRPVGLQAMLSVEVRSVFRQIKDFIIRNLVSHVGQGIQRKLNPGLFSRGGLRHFGIFPCFNFAIAQAGLVTEIVYTPLSSGKTQMRVRVWAPDLSGLDLGERAVMWWRKIQWAKYAKIVTDEDAPISVAVQRGLRNKGATPLSSGIFSEREQLVHLFQEIYLAQMGETPGLRAAAALGKV